jgi:beta-phosphoglucomutase
MDRKPTEHVGAILKRLIKQGVRPTSDAKQGIPWTYKELGIAVRRGEKTIQNWCSEEGDGPPEIDALCLAFFGERVGAEREAEKKELQQAYRKARGWTGSDDEPGETIQLLKATDSSVHNFILTRRLLETSEAIDLWLYTSETVLSFLRSELRDCAARVRLLIRRPESDPEVKAQALASVRLVSDLAAQYPKVRFSVRFYGHDPFLRFYDFRGVPQTGVGLVGLYYHAKVGRRLRGAEENELIVCDSLNGFSARLLERSRSRFTLAWSNSGSNNAVIFDLDGVIVDSMPIYEIAWTQALEAHGVHIDRMDVYYREGESKPITARELYLKAKGVLPSEKVTEQIVSAVDSVYKKNFVLQLTDGIQELLAELKEKAVRCALVTGSSRATLNFLMNKADLFDMFDVTVSGDETQAGKPHPDPYLQAIMRLELDPANCIVIENAPFGVQSATAAGALCLGFIGSSPLPKQALLRSGAAQVSTTIRELRRFLTWVDTNASMKDVLKWLEPLPRSE